MRAGSPCDGDLLRPTESRRTAHESFQADVRLTPDSNVDHISNMGWESIAPQQRFVSVPMPSSAHPNEAVEEDRPATTTTIIAAAAIGSPTDNVARWVQPPQQQQATTRPRRKIYMDGVFDLFHVGHLRAIEQCAALGDRVVIGVTGDKDAASYKRPPILSQHDRVAVIQGLSIVDTIVCPCPLNVTESFLEEYAIDLAVHGFADAADPNLPFLFVQTSNLLDSYTKN